MIIIVTNFINGSNVGHSIYQLCEILASVPGLPRSVRVLIMRIIKMRTERGRPGTEASEIPQGGRVIDIPTKLAR